MARVKITEYRAKTLILPEAYAGREVRSSRPSFPRGARFVAKVDQGIKKRFKQGLVVVDVSRAEALRAIAGWRKKGFERFLIEPYFPHAEREESYLSLERVREGIRVLFAKEGGITIEEHPEHVRTHVLRSADDVSSVARECGIPDAFLSQLYKVFEEHHFAFLEINPLVLRGGETHLLDAAVLVDSAASFFVKNSWSEDDIVEARRSHPIEARVEALDKTTPASLKLNVLNPHGSLFFLLSAGGGSIVIADQAALLGAGKEIGNYGEYSGGPTREETYLYAREILSLLLTSKAKRKALVIAGPVANFTDVKQTFLGIIDALTERAAALRKAGVRVFVRRGGPNEEAGLSLMRAFLEEEKLLGSVHGSEAPITVAVEEAISTLSL